MGEFAKPFSLICATHENCYQHTDESIGTGIIEISLRSIQGKLHCWSGSLNISQVLFWDRGRPYWRSLPRDGQILKVDVKWIYLDRLEGCSGTGYIAFAHPDSGFSYAYVLTPEGELAVVETSRDERNEIWQKVWTREK